MPDQSANTIDFYFDYISHNAYLAWHVLPALAVRHGCAVEPIPVLFAGFLQVYGQLGPAEIEPKIRWMNRDNLRKALNLGIPLNAPERHPFNPLFLLRLTAQLESAERRSELTGILLRGVWVDALDANDVDGVEAYLREHGFDAADLIAGVGSNAAKDAVKSNTDECISRGGFGVPTMIVGDEVFWGYDDLAHLEQHVSGADPLADYDTESYLSAWESCRRRGQHRRRSR
jgi:2-hydroxychromene-2-carboxylate isomerase